MSANDSKIILGIKPDGTCSPFKLDQNSNVITTGSGLAFSMAGYGPAGALALQGVTRFAVYGYEY